jgi:flagellar protein FliO/FliZ
MDGISFLRAIGALLIVFGLLGGFAVLLRRYGHKISGFSLPNTSNKTARLAVVESKFIDARTKLILVRRDKTEHLLLISATGTIVVEPNIHAESAA